MASKSSSSGIRFKASSPFDDCPYSCRRTTYEILKIGLFDIWCVGTTDTMNADDDRRRRRERGLAVRTGPGLGLKVQGSHGESTQCWRAFT